MQTNQTENLQKMVQKTGKQTLIFKTFLVFSILIILALGNTAKAQRAFFEVNNFSSCSTWTITAEDASNTVLGLPLTTTGSGYFGGSCILGTAIDHFRITESGGTCGTIFFFPTAGVFVFQSISKTCCGGNNLTISETTQNSCGGLPTQHITINIK